MDAGGIHSRSHIHPVVDQKRHAVPVGDLLHPSRQFHIFSGAFVLLSQLQKRHASLQRSLHRPEKGFLRVIAAVRHKIQRRIQTRPFTDCSVHCFLLPDALTASSR